MNNDERIEKWQIAIDKIIIDYKNLNKCCNAASEIGCLDSNGRLFDAIWKNHDTMLRLIDKQDWIAWYIYDNDCGKAEMKAGYDEKIKPIRNSRDLAKLIVKAEDRNDNAKMT